jgi:prepilin-type N-terminal cleavage/methylation domain-containing protein
MWGLSGDVGKKINRHPFGVEISADYTLSESVRPSVGGGAVLPTPKSGRAGRSLFRCTGRFERNDSELLAKSNQVSMIQESQRDRQAATTSIGGKVRRGGMTLIEVMVAITILMIALIGTSSMYVSGRRYVGSQQKYQVAAQLASQRLEELKAVGYPGITVGETEEELSVCGLNCKRYSRIELTAEPTADFPKPCKKVTVVVVWPGAAQEDREVKLVTYIGP